MIKLLIRIDRSRIERFAMKSNQTVSKSINIIFWAHFLHQKSQKINIIELLI